MFNRIRVEDIGAAHAFLARRNERGVFNVTDDEPAPPQDVVSFAATLMGVEPPPEQAFETADLTPMARSFYGENKRVSNAGDTWPRFRFQLPGVQNLPDTIVGKRPLAGLKSPFKSDEKSFQTRF